MAGYQLTERHRLENSFERLRIISVRVECGFLGINKALKLKIDVESQRTRNRPEIRNEKGNGTCVEWCDLCLSILVESSDFHGFLG